jgi:hypothetical protein
MKIENIITPALQRQVRETSLDAGWHLDPKTGEPVDRPFSRMIALIHSELSEASRAEFYGCTDDKLPHRNGVEVEMADCLIRIMDECEANQRDLVGAIDLILPHWSMIDGDIYRQLVFAHAYVSDALEADRKNTIVDLGGHVICGRVYGLAKCAIALMSFCQRLRYDLHSAIIEKDAYNRKRADHKMKARASAGGKAY